jgi:hypothetical protein
LYPGLVDIAALHRHHQKDVSLNVTGGPFFQQFLAQTHTRKVQIDTLQFALIAKIKNKFVETCKILYNSPNANFIDYFVSELDTVYKTTLTKEEAV